MNVLLDKSEESTSNLHSKHLGKESVWELGEVPDELDYKRSSTAQSKKLNESSRNSMISMQGVVTRLSSKLDDRVKVMYEKRRRSLDKLEEIKRRQKEEAIQDCTFKPMIKSYQFRKDLTGVFERLVISHSK
eukprot:TRINITY_DN8538_c0_g5_i1.p4 TRINITY_DN8538_c0_g5~~TRINITY_DN8538_c0_g5_i1.p4  ORF type:complete len:132 (-),score=23.85 TRINITY_DN8538_c0_g5_i1:480-875(-)